MRACTPSTQATRVKGLGELWRVKECVNRECCSYQNRDVNACKNMKNLLAWHLRSLDDPLLSPLPPCFIRARYAGGVTAGQLAAVARKRATRAAQPSSPAASMQPSSAAAAKRHGRLRRLAKEICQAPATYSDADVAAVAEFEQTVAAVHTRRLSAIRKSCGGNAAADDTAAEDAAAAMGGFMAAASAALGTVLARTDSLATSEQHCQLARDCQVEVFKAYLRLMHAWELGSTTQICKNYNKLQELRDSSSTLSQPPAREPRRRQRAGNSTSQLPTAGADPEPVQLRPGQGELDELLRPDRDAALNELLDFVDRVEELTVSLRHPNSQPIDHAGIWRGILERPSLAPVKWRKAKRRRIVCSSQDERRLAEWCYSVVPFRWNKETKVVRQELQVLLAEALGGCPGVSAFELWRGWHAAGDISSSLTAQGLTALRGRHRLDR